MTLPIERKVYIFKTIEVNPKDVGNSDREVLAYRLPFGEWEQIMAKSVEYPEVYPHWMEVPNV